MVGCEGCRRDNFTAPDGTLLENHVSDGEGAPFTWVRTFGGNASPGHAEIQNNAVGTTTGQFWRYITNPLPTDSIELEIQVLGDISMVSQQYDIGIVLRNNDPGNGGFDGYTIFWSAFGDGRGFADAFITVDRPGANILFEENVPVPTPGIHTLGAAVLEDGTINVYVDGALTAAVVDQSPLPEGNAGLNFGWTGSPPGIVWITTFAEGLHAPDSATVKLERDDIEVWPSGLTSRDGASGPDNVELRVSALLNDTTVKNKWVKLFLAAVDSAGQGSDRPYGHFHTGANGLAKPAGTLSEDSVNTGSSGIGILRYTSSPVSGPVMIRAQLEGARSDSMTIPVGVRGLERLVPSATFDTVGVTLIHPSSHWVSPTMRLRASALADSFFAAFNKKIGFNDASLPFGGRFDLEQQWERDTQACVARGGRPNGCHQRHRVGLNLDIRTRDFVEAESVLVRRVWKNLAKAEVGIEGDHFYLFSP